MLERILDGLQNLHFDTLTLSPIKANLVKRWSKVETISFIGLTMCVLSVRDVNIWLGVHAMVSKKAQ